MSEESKRFMELLDNQELLDYMRMRNKWPEAGDKLVIEGHVWTRQESTMSNHGTSIPQARVTTWRRNPGRMCWLTIDLFDITFASYNEDDDVVTYRLREYGELE
jgi:hypothetical protein